MAVLPKKPKPPTTIGDIYTGGYTGSGWNYDGQTYGIPASQSVTPGGAKALGTLPFSSAATGAATDATSGLPRGVDETTVPDFTIEDYMGKLQSDPLWGTGETAFMTSIDRAQQQMVRDPFRQALIAYGPLNMSNVPTNLQGPAQGIIDQTTLDEAARNPTSTMALLNQALSRGQSALPYQLGGARSGTALVAGRRLNEAYQLQSQQALQTLLGVLTGGQAKFGAYSDQQRAVWEQAKAAIADRLARAAETALQAKLAAARAVDVSGSGGYRPPVENVPPTDTSVWNPPGAGVYEDYTPAGTYNPETQQIEAPGGGAYSSGGGEVYYQSNAPQSPYRKKPLY
jgi:hypothetical protein